MAKSNELENENRSYPDREKGEAEKLFRAWKESQDEAAREKLICQHLYLVQAVAKKFSGLGESTDDLISEGVMGLMNAVDLFDPERGVQFATYATHLIDGQIRHYLRDKSKLIREPAWIQERLTRITRAAEALTHKLGRPARINEIAEAAELSEKQVLEALKTQERTRVSSLDSTRMRDSDDGDNRSEVERLIMDSGGFSGLAVEDRLFLQQAMSRLKALEQKVLHHFYYMDLNQTEIARKLGISVNYASYLLRGALAKLKQAFDAQAQIAVETATPGVLARRNQNSQVLYSLATQSQQTAAVSGLAPETYFRQLLSQEVMRSARYPQQFALIVIEPDGSEAWPEETLANNMRALSLRVRDSVRMVDVVARLGAHRIGLLLPQTGREATIVADRLGQKTSGGVTLSIGLAIFPHDGNDEAALETRAMEGLRQAQIAGGNRVCRVKGHGESAGEKKTGASPRKRS
jgi:RNA polymerase sigma-B factor